MWLFIILIICLLLLILTSMIELLLNKELEKALPIIVAAFICVALFASVMTMPKPIDYVRGDVVMQVKETKDAVTGEVVDRDTTFVWR